MVSNKKLFALKMKTLKDFGRKTGGQDYHPAFGINGKFTDFQAVVGLEQMKRLPERLVRKKVIYDRYRKHLENVDGIRFIDTKKSEIPWMVDIYVEYPKKLKKFLENEGIGTRLMYPPVHKQPYCDLDMYLPITEYYSKRGLWLPSSPYLDLEDVDAICRKIRKVYG